MMAIYRALGAVRRKVQVIFLTGHNHQLYDKVVSTAPKLGIPTVALPFNDQMSELMAAVDLMVTKAGGLTTFEAISRRLPLAIDMITAPMPQEAGNADLVFNAGLAKPVYHANEIVPLVEGLKQDPDRLSRPLPKVYNLDKTGAAYDIAKIILEYASPKFAKVLTGQRNGSSSAGEETIPKVVGLQ